MQPAMECPRKAEATMGVQREHKTHWRPDGTCSYCGSISPDMLFAAIEAGAQLGPTDKSYKVYVDLPHPDAGKPCVLGSANFEQKGEGWVEITPENRADLPLDDYQRKNYRDGTWVHVTTRGPINHAKFYFQHLSEAEMQRFVDLFNARKLNIGFPGHFYVEPFFMTPVESGDHLGRG